MASTQKYLNHLLQTWGITPACSEEERAASEDLARIFRNHGFEPEVQEFSASQSSKIAQAVMGIMVFVGAVLLGLGGVPGVLGLLLAVAAAVLYGMERTGRPVLSRLGASGLSQNVIAYHKATGPLASPRNRPVVVVAHYDSPRVDMLAQQPYSAYRSMIVKALPYAMMAPAAVAVLRLLPFPGAVKVVLWLVAVVAALVPLAYAASIIANRFVLPYTSGAVSNKSGVAAMLGVMDAVAPFQGGEEFPADRPFSEYMAEQQQIADSLMAQYEQGYAAEDTGSYADSASETPEAEQPSAAPAASADMTTAMPALSEAPAAAPSASSTWIATGDALGGTKVMSALEIEQALQGDAAAEDAVTEGADAEPSLGVDDAETPAEPEPSEPTVNVLNAEGNIRYGEEAIRGLGMLPQDCALVYEEDALPVVPAREPVAAEADEPEAEYVDVSENDEPAATDEPDSTDAPEDEEGAVDVPAEDEEPAVEESDEMPMVDPFVFNGALETIEQADAPVGQFFDADASAAEPVGEFNPYADVVEQAEPAPAPAPEPVFEPEPVDVMGVIVSDADADPAEFLTDVVVLEVGEIPAEPEPVVVEPDQTEVAEEAEEEEMLPPLPVDETLAVKLDQFQPVAPAEGETATFTVPDEVEATQVSEPLAPHENSGEIAGAPADETVEQTAVFEPVAEAEQTAEAPASEQAESADAVEPASADATASLPVAEEPKRASVSNTAAIDALMAQIKASAPQSRPQRTAATPQAATGARVIRQVPPVVPDMSHLQQIPAASRAALFDLPDPSSKPVDPFATNGEGIATTATSPATSTTISRNGFTVVNPGDVPPARSSANAQTAEPATPAEAFETITAPAPSREETKPRRGLGKLFGRKKKDQDSMSEWLGVEDDFDAKRSGADIGSWDNFEGDDKGWKGGATGSADMTDEELRDAITSMGDDELLGHDIWFVATGASEYGNAGLKAFLASHRDKLRGVFLVNLDSVGAGMLSMLSTEGESRVLKGDKRIMRLVSQVSRDFHSEIATVEMPYLDTDAHAAMEMSLRSLTIAGADGTGLACSHTEADQPFNVDEHNVARVADVVTEVIRRS